MIKKIRKENAVFTFFKVESQPLEPPPSLGIQSSLSPDAPWILLFTVLQRFPRFLLIFPMSKFWESSVLTPLLSIHSPGDLSLLIHQRLSNSDNFQTRFLPAPTLNLRLLHPAAHSSVSIVFCSKIQQTQTQCSFISIQDALTPSMLFPQSFPS